ncbi:MAG: DUF6159 family protein [Candidatus Thorarchaeota archaeon]
MTDLLTYHTKENYPSHKGAIAGLLVVFGAFIAAGVYSLMYLWEKFDISAIIASLGIDTFFLDNMIYIAGFFGAIILFTILVGIGASALANRLGGTLIYIGAIFMNVMTWLGVILLWVATGFNFAALIAAWPIMIPGLFTLLITVLLFTVFKDRVKRAGEIIKLTGRVCLDEKGVFVPPLLTMIFTLVSAILFAAITFTLADFMGIPLDEFVAGTATITVENGWPLIVGLVLYLFVTIFFYNFAYATSSGMVYIYMRGQDPGLGDGIKGALNVIGGIIVLSIAGVIVRLIVMAIRALTRNQGVAGRAVGGIAAGIINWVWALINYFTIPVMVAEEKGAKDGIKTSASLVKNNFVDVIIKETAVRWGFGVLAFFVFFSFTVGGAVIGWFLSAGDILTTILLAILFLIFAAIPSTLILRTFDIVYVTLLYIFIRKKEGDISGKTRIPADMNKELDRAYTSAKNQ